MKGVVSRCEEERIKPKKKKTKLTESEKLKRAEARKDERTRKKIAKEAEKAAHLAARNRVEVADASLRLEYSSSFAAAWPAVIELLRSRGFELAPPCPGSNMIVTWRAMAGDRSARRGILFVDAIKGPITNMRSVLSQFHLPLSEMTLAIIGPDRARCATDVAFLERQVTVRCIHVPRSGQGPEAKYTAKISEVLTTYADILIKLVRNQLGDRQAVGSNVADLAVTSASDLWNGLAVKDVQKWTGAKPKTNAEAWLYFLRVILPNHAADAVALAYPTYSLLNEAFLSRGPSAIIDLTLNTPNRMRLGPANANKLHSIFTSTNPNLVV
mmetsp:Transcript_258/g.336  ORF Transcript_258/g.336 Transcript_258/m.336 type:complete len:327 (+) Transcript_258:240-1220(+)